MSERGRATPRKMRADYGFYRSKFDVRNVLRCLDRMREQFRAEAELAVNEAERMICEAQAVAIEEAQNEISELFK